MNTNTNEQKSETLELTADMLKHSVIFDVTCQLSVYRFEQTAKGAVAIDDATLFVQGEGYSGLVETTTPLKFLLALNREKEPLDETSLHPKIREILKRHGAAIQAEIGEYLGGRKGK